MFFKFYLFQAVHPTGACSKGGKDPPCALCSMKAGPNINNEVKKSSSGEVSPTEGKLPKTSLHGVVLKSNVYGLNSFDLQILSHHFSVSIVLIFLLEILL